MPSLMHPSSLRRAVSAFVILSALLMTVEAHAAPEAGKSTPIGFSNLVFRLDDEDEIGVAREDFRVFILETMRARGLNAVGAEDLVFGKDKADSARLVLGGTVSEIDCHGEWQTGNCRITVEWQLRDEQEDRVIYKVTSRYNAMDLTVKDVESLGKRLIVGAIEKLVARPRFMELVNNTLPARATSSPSHARANLRACPTQALQMPAATEAVLAASVLVMSGNRFGSGTIISPDGYVLTAAHVLGSGELFVRTRAGKKLGAKLVRRADKADVALLHIEGDKDTEYACLSLSSISPAPGKDVYAIGSPASEELAFSITRGIVSGTPVFEGTTYLQTDASINRGNSGGPLVDETGQLSAVVTWKVAGNAIEGLAFGVPSAVARSVLGLEFGAETDGSLLAEASSAAAATPSAGEPFVDTADPLESIDPAGDLRRKRSEMTPAYVKAMKLGGYIAAGTGVALVTFSWLRFDEEEDTLDQFRTARLLNDIGWVMGVAGVASAVVGIVLTPSLEDARAAMNKPSVAVGFGLDRATLNVRF